MKTTRAILLFMKECIIDDVIVNTWGMNHIRMTENQISFSVNGFNYHGEITVAARNGELLLYSSKGHIGIIKEAKKAIEVLDKYIEANDDEYGKIHDLLFP